MTKSRLTPSSGLLLPVFLLAAPAGAQEIDPGTLIARQRQELIDGARLNCPPSADEEITVCARRPSESQGPRSPLPYAPEPGAVARGESPANFGCDRLCTQPVGASLFQAIDLVGRALRNLRERGDR